MLHIIVLICQIQAVDGLSSHLASIIKRFFAKNYCLDLKLFLSSTVKVFSLKTRKKLFIKKIYRTWKLLDIETDRRKKLKREKEKVRMRKSQTTVIIIFLLDYIFLENRAVASQKFLGWGAASKARGSRNWGTGGVLSPLLGSGVKPQKLSLYSPFKA